MQTLTPLVAEALVDVGDDVSGNPDLQPFEVTCLHPGRTLIEKIMILNSKISPGTTRDEIVATWMARHLYDVHELLGDQRVLDLLSEREVFDAIVVEHLAVSETFGGSAPRPQGGFSDAYAFNAAAEHRDVLAAAYTDGIEALYYAPPEALPSWRAIEERVHALAHLL